MEDSSPAVAPASSFSWVASNGLCVGSVILGSTKAGVDESLSSIGTSSSAPTSLSCAPSMGAKSSALWLSIVLVLSGCNITRTAIAITKGRTPNNPNAMRRLRAACSSLLRHCRAVIGSSSWPRRGMVVFCTAEVMIML